MVPSARCSNPADTMELTPGGYIGSNGLTFDAEERLIVCQHGNGRIIRLEKKRLDYGPNRQVPGKTIE